MVLVVLMVVLAALMVVLVVLMVVLVATLKVVRLMFFGCLLLGCDAMVLDGLS